MSPFSVGKLLPHIAKKHCGRTFLCFRNALVERIFWIGGVSQFCQSFSSHIAEKHRGRTLLCFRNALLSIFWKIWVSRFGRFFCLTVPKDFLGKPSVFYKIYGMEKIIDKRRRTPFFIPKFLVSQCRKSRRGTLRCFKDLGYRQIVCIRGQGGITILLRIMFCPKWPKNNVGKLFCVSEMFWYQKFFG